MIFWNDCFDGCYFPAKKIYPTLWSGYHFLFEWNGLQHGLNRVIKCFSQNIIHIAVIVAYPTATTEEARVFWLIFWLILWRGGVPPVVELYTCWLTLHDLAHPRPGKLPDVLDGCRHQPAIINQDNIWHLVPQRNIGMWWSSICRMMCMLAKVPVLGSSKTCHVFHAKRNGCVGWSGHEPYLIKLQWVHPHVVSPTITLNQ